MKKIHNIVITGGPCGGKTTALEKISKTFREMGYLVLIVNETATELIRDGILIAFNEEHFSNALYPMFVTFSGIITDFKLIHP